MKLHNDVGLLLLLVCALLAGDSSGQDVRLTCGLEGSAGCRPAGTSDTFLPPGSCCPGSSCQAPVAPDTSPAVCSKCPAGVCILAGGLAVCCASWTTCIPGDQCCPNNQVCLTSAGTLKCCGTGSACDGGECLPCPAERMCAVLVDGIVRKQCCPLGSTCQNNTCVPDCPRPRICPINGEKGCCPEGTQCATAPNGQLGCCRDAAVCTHPLDMLPPKCCKEGTVCNGFYECVECPAGTSYCPASQTCCDKTFTKCFGGQCCPTDRVCTSSDGTERCCPEDSFCSNGACTPVKPPCPPPSFYCWWAWGGYTCCNQSSACLPNTKEGCCDPPKVPCPSYPPTSLKVNDCCDASRCLNILYPGPPGSVDIATTCCPKELICKFQDPITLKPLGEPLCCSTSCTPLNPADPTSERFCCPNERWIPEKHDCCPPGTIWSSNLQTCLPKDPPCLPPLNSICPLSNGTILCCPAGQCFGGTVGCCKDGSLVCPVWPGLPTSEKVCCNTTCLHTLYPSPITAPTVGVTTSCCPTSRICQWLGPTGPDGMNYCCSTSCTPWPVPGGTVSICCPKEQNCAGKCCPLKAPCLNGECCPLLSQCLDPLTGKKTCCKDGSCALDPATNTTICCRPQLGSSLCPRPLPTIPVTFKQICCPQGTLCIPKTGQCCRKPQYCVSPLTGQSFCCKPEEVCVGNGQCCPLNLVCKDPLTGALSCCPTGSTCVPGQGCCPKPRLCSNGTASTPTCCAAGSVCVAGQCCAKKQTCLNPLTGQLSCCPAGMACIAGQCCPTSQACGNGAVQTCCSSGSVCIKGQCCQQNQTCSAAPGALSCCPTGSTCVPGQGCCANTRLCSNGTLTCCAAGTTCIAGVCCARKQTCLSSAGQLSCCPLGSSCIGGQCCPGIQVCSVGITQFCCPSNSACIPGTRQCCPANLVCKNPATGALACCLNGSTCSASTGLCA